LRAFVTRRQGRVHLLRDRRDGLEKTLYFLDLYLRVIFRLPNYFLFKITVSNKKAPWPVVRKQTIPTERPPLVGEVSANFSGG
jgi:hypothetical protein